MLFIDGVIEAARFFPGLSRVWKRARPSGLVRDSESANWAKSDMLELPTGLGKLAKWLPRAIRELAWPVILIGVLYLLLPDQLLGSLSPEAPKYRWLTGLAVLLCGSFAVFSLRVRIKISRAIKSARHRVRYRFLPLRSRLWLGPVAQGGVRRLYLDPDDEAVQVLIDRGFAYVEASGQGYITAAVSPQGHDFVKANRRRLCDTWSSGKYPSEVDQIRQAEASARRCANRLR
jgi:hypothetical protein